MTWPECQQQVNKFTGALFRKFPSEAEAREFVDHPCSSNSNSNSNRSSSTSSKKRKQTMVGSDDSKQLGGESQMPYQIPTSSEVHFFTDCSARNNQSASCKASWGVTCTCAPSTTMIQGRKWCGVTEPKQILQDGRLVTARPTNIRGEGEALIEAMKLACLQPPQYTVKIFSDSHFWIVDMYTKYIPSWIRNNIPWSQKKNSDLAEQFWQLAQTLQQTHTLEFVFVRAWHDLKRPAQNSWGYYTWDGNRLAEQAAESALYPHSSSASASVSLEPELAIAPELS